MAKMNRTQREVLALLVLSAPRTYESLAQATGLSHRTIQRAVRGLEKSGHVKAPSRSRGKAWTVGMVHLAKRSASLATGVESSVAPSSAPRKA